MSTDVVSTRVDFSAATAAVTGQPKGWLRLEAAFVTVLAIIVYFHGGHSWILLAVLFLVPDITFAAYAAGPVVGAIFYNLAHTYVVPIALGAILYFFNQSTAVPLIWIAHVGWDRSLGYGLKYNSGFAYTHLGLLGKNKP